MQVPEHGEHCVCAVDVQLAVRKWSAVHVLHDWHGAAPEIALVNPVAHGLHTVLVVEVHRPVSSMPAGHDDVQGVHCVSTLAVQLAVV